MLGDLGAARLGAQLGFVDGARALGARLRALNALGSAELASGATYLSDTVGSEALGVEALNHSHFLHTPKYF